MYIKDTGTHKFSHELLRGFLELVDHLVRSQAHLGAEPAVSIHKVFPVAKEPNVYKREQFGSEDSVVGEYLRTGTEKVILEVEIVLSNPAFFTHVVPLLGAHGSWYRVMMVLKSQFSKMFMRVHTVNSLDYTIGNDAFSDLQLTDLEREESVMEPLVEVWFSECNADDGCYPAVPDLLFASELISRLGLEPDFVIKEHENTRVSIVPPVTTPNSRLGARTKVVEYSPVETRVLVGDGVKVSVEDFFLRLGI